MTPYRRLPMSLILIISALPIGLLMWRHSVARPGEPWACAPLLVIYVYGLVAARVNRVWVKVTEEGVANGIGPMPCGPSKSWMPRAEIGAVYVRRVRVKYGHYQAAGVERRDGLCRDLTDAFAPDEEDERAAAEIIQALRWTEPILRPDENRLLQDESKVTEAFALWIVLLVAAVVWMAL